MFRRFRRTDETIGFALSGGGSRGASQVGGLRALIEAGVSPHLIAGTSAGAVNAAWFGLFPERLDQMEAIWLGLRQRDVFPGGRARMLFNMARRGYVHDSTGWERLLRAHYQDATFEDTSIPCAVVAVRLRDGARVVFDSGPIVPALMASTAIPGVFPAYRIGGELYVDGGLLEYMPVATLLERGATTVYALDCSHYRPDSVDTEPVVDRCGRIAAQASVAALTALSQARGRAVHVLRPELPVLPDGRDFRLTADLVRAGYEYTMEYLRDLQSPQLAGARIASVTGAG